MICYPEEKRLNRLSRNKFREDFWAFMQVIKLFLAEILHTYVPWKNTFLTILARKILYLLKSKHTVKKLFFPRVEYNLAEFFGNQTFHDCEQEYFDKRVFKNIQD